MKITLSHNGQEIESNSTDSLLTTLKAAGVEVRSACGGCASCGQCVVVVSDGDLNLQEPTFEEKQLIGNVFHITKERLACQTYLNGDVTIDLSSHYEDKKPKAVTKRRTREEADKVVEDRKIKFKEKQENKPKRQGGGKKPKAFNFIDDNNNDQES